MSNRCPHCDSELQMLRTPPQASWNSPFLFVCFNDQCSYFRRSLLWMKSQFNVSVMYRFRLDPDSGQTGPFPVWSEDALKDCIVSPDQVESAGEGEA